MDYWQLPVDKELSYNYCSGILAATRFHFCHHLHILCKGANEKCLKQTFEKVICLQCLCTLMLGVYQG